ncbi:hypothetical protein [Cellulomonas sp.]|uniref:hypothetical protein n=1 Tax=Cellulomonas sp. TaxID=40001 RepID=UPI001B0E12CD|nr:hypothetical protein [Cellulomonas sp.]MBO9555626.1 hypothetical protein [Cellulomonas sp.]
MRRTRRPGRTLAVAATTLSLLPALTGCAPTTPGGTLRTVDDTGHGSTAVDDDWVLTLPADDDASWTLLHARPSDALDRLQTPVDPDDVTALGGTWQPVRSGRFDLPADLTGTYLLCWAVPSDTGPAIEPVQATTRGCAEVALDDGARVEATWGAGGFGAQSG